MALDIQQNILKYFFLSQLIVKLSPFGKKYIPKCIDYDPHFKWKAEAAHVIEVVFEFFAATLDGIRI